MKHSILIALSFVLMMTTGSTVIAQTTRHVCQSCGIQGAYTTISAAISAAQNGDVINIWGEETSPGSEILYEYPEHLVIDKTLTLTCENPEPNLGYPIITQSFAGFNPPGEIIHIQSSGHFSVVQHLNIRGPATGYITDCSGDPMLCMGQKAGIRIDTNSCSVIDCGITRCMTGIVLSGVQNSVIGCTVGDRWWWENEPADHREEYWSASHNFPMLTTIHHPGNGFGIVQTEPDWVVPQSGYESRMPNEVVDSVIRSNRYWGIVLTNGSRAQVSHNIIAWNGDYSVNQDWTSIPDKSGGLLSLFTDSQITNNLNDNKRQNPVIRSNNIYGNKGYQIGIFTGSDSCSEIFNSPVIMSNNIGVEADMPPVTPTEDYNFLVCAGPTPVSTPSNPPDPCDPNYAFYGSGPIIAWNNYNDPTEFDQRRMYHPMQKNRWPPGIGTPTSTPVPNTPTPTPLSAMPTGIPYIPPGTPATPGPGYYQMNDQNWEIPGLRDDPRFVGWLTPEPGLPPEFDWHLRDYPSDPESTQTPSSCFNQGGIELNPGSTRADGMRDTGFADLGRHIQEPVPNIKKLTAYQGTSGPYMVHLEWNIPEYYPDGSLFHFYDIGGHMVYWGKRDLTSPGPDLVIIPISKPIYLDASTTETELDIRYAPNDSEYLGVIIYTVRMTESEIAWVELPD